MKLRNQLQGTSGRKKIEKVQEAKLERKFLIRQESKINVLNVVARGKKDAAK